MPRLSSSACGLPGRLRRWAWCVAPLLCLALTAAGAATAAGDAAPASSAPTTPGEARPGEVKTGDAAGDSAARAHAARQLTGDWQGQLVFRGDALGVRLHVRDESDGDGAAEGKHSTGRQATFMATLDIPSLLMAWQPVAMTWNGGAWEAELPLGIGRVPLAVDEAGVRGAAVLGDDDLVLDLQRDVEPSPRLVDVTLHDGDIRLAGRLALPAGPGPHPAVVLLHGSGAIGRDSWSYASRADFLARRGYAALFYDKRGVGASSPVEKEPDLRDLEQDARAALAFLRQRPEVDPARVGLLGWSQGSWLAMAIAADPSDVAFVILGSPAAVTPAEQEMQKIAAGMRDDGVSENQIRAALDYYELYFQVARTGDGWESLRERMAQGAGSTWFSYVDQPRTPADLAWWHANHDYPAASLLPHVHVPVLALYGGADWMTPPEANAARLESLLRSGGNDQVTVAVVAGGDHRIELPMGPDEEGRWRWPRVAPAMLTTLEAWLDDLRPTTPAALDWKYL